MADYDIKLLEPTSYDTRLMERHLSEGRLTPADLEKQLASLPDLANQSVEFTVVLGEDEGAGSARRG